MASYKYLQQVLEHQSVQNYLDETEGELIDATSRFYNLPEVVETTIINSLGDFIGENVEHTWETMINFVAETVSTFLDQITTSITEGTYKPLP